jgi:hypothetical protein
VARAILPKGKTAMASSSMGLKRRLAKLEAAIAVTVGGCMACRDRRGDTVLVSGDLSPEGSFVPSSGAEMPAPCPECGEVPEEIIQITEVLVEADSHRSKGGK